MAESKVLAGYCPTCGRLARGYIRRRITYRFQQLDNVERGFLASFLAAFAAAGAFFLDWPVMGFVSLVLAMVTSISSFTIGMLLQRRNR